MPVSRVEFNYTRATGHWTDRTWNTIPATITGSRATAAIPRGTTVSYFNVVDTRDCVVSSAHVEHDSRETPRLKPPAGVGKIGRAHV